MKKKMKALALLLTLALATTSVPVSAAPNNNNKNSQSSSQNNGNGKNNNSGKDNNGKDNNKKDNNKKGNNKKEQAAELQLVEDESTVKEGTVLRAATYAAETYAMSNSDNVKYFDATLFDYDKEKINSATFSANSRGQGFYFDNYATYGGNWNDWQKGQNVNYPNGGYIYSGIVKSDLDASGNLQFSNGKDVGIFDATKSVNGKTVYPGQKLPYEYDSVTRYYTFDSSKMSARYDNTSPYMRYLNQPQTLSADIGSLEETGFFPFNDSMSVIGSGMRNPNANYYFGMTTSVNFSMTANGRMDASDGSSDPIRFNFTGDDDVWVFVDGKLVLDLGGIHDAVSGSIDFADNSVTYFSATGSMNDNVKTGDAGTSQYVKDTGKTVTIGTATNKKRQIFSQGQIFKTVAADGSVTEGKLSKDRETFAAESSHTLTVYYPERGAGASNCKIEFNLPVKDSINVTKKLDDRLYDKNTGKPAGESLSDADKASLANRDFTFVLYEDGEACKNFAYSLYASNGSYLENHATGNDGSFTLKYGQTAKFWTIIDEDKDVEYYVREMNLTDSWTAPKWEEDNSKMTYPGEVKNNSVPYGSNIICGRGSNEASDVVEFICTNALYNPAVDVANDAIVIDYGLPVKVNVLANDTASAGTLKVTGISKSESGPFENRVNGDFGTFTLTNDSNVAYQLTSMSMTGQDVIYYQVAYDTNEADPVATATLTVNPATSIYYEENFNGIVYGRGSWEPEGSAKDIYQETGVVGDATDSCYGTDNAYKSTAEDSLGTSKYANTVNGAAEFNYTFTGTGTAIFARTSNTSGYIRIVIDRLGDDGESAGNVVTWLRDTRYPDGSELPGKTLYNIPVYTKTDLDYGTYKVTITVAKKTIYGFEFYLDGIRVFEPADPENAAIQSAYNSDLESAVSKITLFDQMIGQADEGEGETLTWIPGNVVFTDSDGEITDPTKFQVIGPKDEVYLSENQKIEFSINDWYNNDGTAKAGANARVYLAAKVPFGGSGTLSVNGTDISINSTVDCYYDITGYLQKNDTSAKVSVKCGSGNSIGLTYLKVTGYPDVVLGNGQNIGGDDIAPGSISDESAEKAENDMGEVIPNEIEE